MGRGGCQGGGGREAMRRRRATSPRRPTPTLRGCRLYRNPPCRREATRRWTRPIRSCTRRSSGCWRTPPPSQRRSAAPRRTPHPAAPPLRRVRPMRVAASLAVVSQHSRALARYHSSPSTPYLIMGTQHTHIYTIYTHMHMRPANIYTRVYTPHLQVRTRIYTQGTKPHTYFGAHTPVALCHPSPSPPSCTACTTK